VLSVQEYPHPHSKLPALTLQSRHSSFEYISLYTLTEKWPLQPFDSFSKIAGYTKGSFLEPVGSSSLSEIRQPKIKRDNERVEGTLYDPIPLSVYQILFYFRTKEKMSRPRPRWLEIFFPLLSSPLIHQCNLITSQSSFSEMITMHPKGGQWERQQRVKEIYCNLWTKT